MPSTAVAVDYRHRRCLMRLLLASLATICALTAGAHSAPAPKDKTTGEKLLGTWKLVRSGQPIPEGTTYFVEFTKDGKMSLRIQSTRKEVEETVLKGTYKLDSDEIDYTRDLPDGGKKQEVLTIRKLTENELVTTDPDDIKEEFERVKDEKKPKKD